MLWCWFSVSHATKHTLPLEGYPEFEADQDCHFTQSKQCTKLMRDGEWCKLYQSSSLHLSPCPSLCRTCSSLVFLEGVIAVKGDPGRFEAESFISWNQTNRSAQRHKRLTFWKSNKLRKTGRPKMVERKDKSKRECEMWTQNDISALSLRSSMTTSLSFFFPFSSSITIPLFSSMTFTSSSGWNNTVILSNCEGPSNNNKNKYIKNSKQRWPLSFGKKGQNIPQKVYANWAVQ